jgi:tRNA (guanine26-N2/guanine27-N2)-dimethyltransferase
MTSTTTEGSATITTHKGKLSKKLPVFYNPLMKFNRDISIILLNSIKRPLIIADPLAGSGIRSIRFIKELKKFKSISINDNNEQAIKNIKQNLKLNNIKNKNITITKKDANEFLIQSTGFDYIDIDPFGSPNPFLDAAIKRIARHGILAATATDTAALTGTYPKACRRKYWATPLRNELMHEVGIRILIRKIQLIAAQYEKAITPIFSYAKDHYYRVFFHSQKSKTACDNILKQHKFFYYCTNCTNQSIYKQICCSTRTQLQAGPLWTGQLHDKKLTKTMLKNSINEQTTNFLKLINKEANTLGFIDLHKVSKKTKTPIIKTTDAIKKIKDATPTHFSSHAIKTNKPIEEIKRLLR